MDDVAESKYNTLILKTWMIKRLIDLMIDNKIPFLINVFLDDDMVELAYESNRFDEVAPLIENAIRY